MSNEFWVLGASPRCALPAQYFCVSTAIIGLGFRVCPAMMP